MGGGAGLTNFQLGRLARGLLNKDTHFISDASFSNQFYWNDGYLFIDGSGGDYYNNPNPVNKTVGGIDVGEEFFLGGKTLPQIMQDMFYPTLYPNLTSPSNLFSDNVSNLQEIADSINIEFTASFNRGSINPAYGTSGFRSGLPNAYNYTGTGLPGTIPSIALTNIQNVNNYIVLIGNRSWTSTVSYDAGEQPKDSEGEDYNTPLSAGTTSTRTILIEGVYPLFGTTSSIANPDTQQALASMLNGNNLVFNMMSETGGKQSFDIPISWSGAPTNRPLIGIETFNTTTSTWEYQGGDGTSSLTYWTSTPEIHSIQGNNINYLRYVYNSDDRGAIQIRLKF